ncbi:hypothetical protein KFZ76_22290 [Methylovulum psychrotolerans]|uniref:hypothetical protein n=1 Tax=Methylovulum psychrotolerans TaxID=1704499 RepID=UPI001BFFCC20|nr:hypothetical protein [Methylovulum psychrotolerans]MBT9100431.1 hypothetical protein [Methylovulum psychrotolerans]
MPCNPPVNDLDGFLHKPLECQSVRGGVTPLKSENMQIVRVVVGCLDRSSTAR